MVIGTSLPQYGNLVELNKWYFGIEILKCPPSQIKIFRPFIFIYCVKYLDLGEPGKLNGRPEKKIGGFKRLTCPYGIKLEIVKF